MVAAYAGGYLRPTGNCAERAPSHEHPDNVIPIATAANSAEQRVARYDWPGLAADLGGYGCAVIEKLLTPEECRQIAALYPHEEHFRSHVHMARHGFGKGEYRYFKYPLPDLHRRPAHRALSASRAGRQRLERAHGRQAMRYPATHPSFLELCHDAGQTRPTPLLLQYVPGDFNCLHQDLYGDLAFPLQVAILLSEPGKDFTGGEFVLTEQRPRMQSRAEVVPLRQGDAVAFAVHNRPVRGTKGNYRVNLRHGVSRVRSGQRHTVGIIFHDAK